MHANSSRLHRREVLRVGSLAGLGLAELLRLEHAHAADAAPTPAKPRREINCIYIFLIGGAPHQDMWDLKPEAPPEIRGDFRPIATNVPGIQVSELLPKCAAATDKLAILRGMTHPDSDHGRGYHQMMTGSRATAGDFNNEKNNNQHPSLGSMVAKFGRNSDSLPPYISVPNFIYSGGPAFLGPSYAPFVIESDPASPEFEVRDISLPLGVAESRNLLRQRALREINKLEQQAESAPERIRAIDTFYDKAFRLMTSQKAKQAFEIGRESEAMRQAYGMSNIGQSCLLARRLVEAGCRFVTIEYGHWDTHRKNTWSLRDVLVPSLDQALPALIDDLSRRGLLDSTLIVLSTEFGRTPRINALAGRDHWPNAFSVVMAGAGLKTGQAVGTTDASAAYVADRPITPNEFAATILYKLGVDPKTVMHTPIGRPVEVAGGGKPIHEIA